MMVNILKSIVKFRRGGIFTVLVLIMVPNQGCVNTQKSPIAASSEVAPSINSPEGQLNSRAVDRLHSKTDQPANNVIAVSTPFGIVYQKADVQMKELPERKSESSIEAPPEKRNPELSRKSFDNWPPATSTREGALEDDDGNITLNFDDADLYEVIHTIGELLRINYIIDPNVGGKVTINTAEGFKMKELWSVFFQILEANGLTAVKEGALYKITPLQDASRLPILSRYGRNAADLPPTERVVMQVIPLRYVNSDEMVKVLSPFISSEGTIISHGNSNTLLIVDKGINVLKTLRLVDMFDTDLFEENYHRFFFLKNADAGDISELIKQILDVYARNEKNVFELIPITRLNAILAISKNAHVFEKIESLLKTMDSQSDVAQKKIYVYSIKNGQAGEMSTLLNTIFGNETGEYEATDQNGPTSDETAKPASQNNPFMKPSTPVSSKTKIIATSGSDLAEGTGTLSGDVTVTADEVRNALVITATPSDYRIIENILLQLDVMPRQVLIEVTIAEIKLDDGNELGVEWSYTQGTTSPAIQPDGSTASKSFSSAVISQFGFQYLIGRTDRWKASLSALASQDKVNVLSSPSVLALDNKEAVINISDELPIASSTYTGLGTDSNIVTTNIQYRNTGLILTVTPHINENGLVSMDISQEVSDLLGNQTVAGASYPSFSTRSVDTSLVVRHNQTIVIGGLIKQRKEDNKKGVPVLQKIPLFGNLFKKSEKSLNKKELVMLITPHVIASLDDIDEITNDVKGKLSKLDLDLDAY